MAASDNGGNRPGGPRSRLTRRTFLKAGAAAGVAGAVGAGLSSGHRRLIDAALSVDSGPFDVSKVKHVVILMQENRSYDHYFGTLANVNGFDDRNIGRYLKNPADPTSGRSSANPFLQICPSSAFPGWAGPKASDGNPALDPFQLVSNPPYENGQTTNDITHDWTPQHNAWNGGAMDQWFAAHAAADLNNSPTNSLYTSSSGTLGTPTTNDGYLTMGYLARPDLAFYHALADAFTLCNGYFCSVMGPTDPNRLMLMSNSCGVGQPGATPLLTTLVQTRPEEIGKFSWQTMPEILHEANINWKVYGDPTAQALFNVLPYFSQYESNAALAANAFGWQYPANFAADVAAGTLPQVSWILPPAQSCEHPAAPPGYGEFLVSQILDTLVANPEVWAQTVFLLIYDENGGWFDHVPPPTYAPGLGSTVDDQYEWVEGLDSSGYVEGPLGLGFRVPCVVISPFSRGGYLCSPYSQTSGGSVLLDPSATFDHTSVNRFINAVFSPNENLMPDFLSNWRQSVTGDLTAAFAPGNYERFVPPLPPTSITNPKVAAAAVVNALAGTVDYAPTPYPQPGPSSNNNFPPTPEATNFTKVP